MVKDLKKNNTQLGYRAANSSKTAGTKAGRKEKYKLAIGLKYDTSDDAPTLSVKGERILADDLVKIAKRYGVPVIEDSNLANALSQIDLDAQIPSELFQPVAILLNELKRTVSQRFPSR